MFSIFFAFISLSLATWPVLIAQQSGSVTGLFRTNLQTEATLAFELPATITKAVFCLQQAELPDASLYSNSTCQFFWSVNTSAKTTLQLRDLNYRFGILTTGNGTFAFEATGASCPTGQVWDEDLCIPINGVITSSNTTVNLPQYSVWALVVPSMDVHVITSFTVSITSQIPGLEAYLRYMASPTEDYFDVQNLPATIQYPASGRWYLALDHDESANVTAQLLFTFKQCPSGSLGNDCSTKIVSAQNGAYFDKVSLVKGQTVYYKYTDVSKPLWVSVKPFSRNINPQDGQPSEVLVQGRNGQVPWNTVEGVHIQNCNRQYCNHAQIIHFNNVSASDRWIIAISPTGEDTEFSVTFGSDCPADCYSTKDQGTCSSAYQTGLCLCRYGWDGEDCNMEAGFNKAYAVLLIISGVVLGAGLISLITSCVTKPREAGYEVL